VPFGVTVPIPTWAKVAKLAAKNAAHTNNFFIIVIFKIVYWCSYLLIYLFIYLFYAVL
jgi:hypothetical protein